MDGARASRDKPAEGAAIPAGAVPQRLESTRCLDSRISERKVDKVELFPCEGGAKSLKIKEVPKKIKKTVRREASKPSHFNSSGEGDGASAVLLCALLVPCVCRFTTPASLFVFFWRGGADSLDDTAVAASAPGWEDFNTQ